MRSLMISLMLMMASAGPASAGWFSSDVAPAELKCEYRENPLGIDATKPSLSWKISDFRMVNEELSSGQSEFGTLQSKIPRGLRQTAYHVLVASSEALLRRNTGDLWDSGKVESDQSLHVEYAGKPLVSQMRCYWKVRVWTVSESRTLNPEPSLWSKLAVWEMGLLNTGEWKAKWVFCSPKAGEGGFPMFRKTFVLDEVPRDARAYISSLGFHELYVNGAKVGDDVLSPAVCQLSERSLYLTHDVGSLLRKGTNCIAIHLGRGWYFRGHQDYAGVQRTGGRPAVLAQVDIRMPDGRRISVATDESWKASPSPFTASTHWGLRYDARLEQSGWNKAGFNDSAWMPVEVCGARMPDASAQMVEPNRIVRVLSPVKIEAKESHSWMVDFGTNVAGWCTLKLHDSRESGKKIVLEFGDDARCDQDRGEYITSGQGEECYVPRFSYQAFRYVKITGLAKAPMPGDVSASLIRTDYATGSSFACSNPRLTAVHDMVSYTFQCLTLGGYMVDCPHIERLGYGGDGQASAESAMVIHPLAPLYRNWMRAWRDCQSPDGDMPHTAPIEFAGGGPYWCGFIIAVPWQMYLQYGDLSALRENYPAMQKWLGFVEQYCKNGDIMEPWPNNNRRNWYLGDWAVPDGVNQNNPEAVKLVVNCYRVYCYDLMTRIAEALGQKEDAGRYRVKADGLRPAVHQALYDAKRQTYAAGGQLDLAFPLLTGVVPEGLRADIVKQLEQDIVVKRNGHLSVGLVGIPILVKTLMGLDRDDLIFSMVDKDTYPGWGYMLKNGATTTWEHWNGARSRIHNCYNSIGMWFYQSLGGIQPDPAAPGYKQFTIKPALVGDISWVKTRLNSVRGAIVSNWRKDGKKLNMAVVIPPNTTAIVYVPAKDQAGVTESGKPAGKARGVKFLRMENGAAVYEVGSGAYNFASEE